MTMRQERFIKNLSTSKDPTEAARRAGYAFPEKISSKLMNDEKIQQKIISYGEVGLDTLDKIARKGKVEIARVQAAKTLVETAYGRPKDNKSNIIGDVTINVLKLPDNNLVEA